MISLLKGINRYISTTDSSKRLAIRCWTEALARCDQVSIKSLYLHSELIDVTITHPHNRYHWVGCQVIHGRKRLSSTLKLIDPSLVVLSAINNDPRIADCRKLPSLSSSRLFSTLSNRTFTCGTCRHGPERTKLFRRDLRVSTIAGDN